jgi:hypothetical protein
MVPIVKEIIVYSRYDFFCFGLKVWIVVAMVDNENYNCIEVALFQGACSTNVIKQGSKNISKSRSHLRTLWVPEV